MDQPVNAFDLSPEQQETKSLLQRLLGSAIASRYVDFCRLAAGAFALDVSRPLAAHALRELDSMLRGALEVPMEARVQVTTEDADKIAKAREQLSALGFEEQVIDRAVRELKPRLNHKQQIRQIASRLGLAPDCDIANLWTSLAETFGGAHQRSFHRSLQVDDDFRERYQRPFDTVIRGVAVALQGRYVALMRRVEQLAAMTDRKQAAKLFAGEIPGALPLQRHFFERLQTADWLPHLAKQGLLGEPLAGPDEGAAGGMRFRQWPAGNYLLRMAKSADAVTRHVVAEALRKVGSSKHPDVQYDGLEILAALPAEESAPLADVAVSWLSPGTRNWPMQTPEALIKKLTEGGQRSAAMKVARALLQIWEQNGHLVTHYAHHMYEHHLPSLVGLLAACCGEDALRLFADLLQEAARITKRIDSGHYSMRAMADDGMARHDVYESLISAVRRSAEAVIQADATRMRGVVEFLAGYEPKIFVRLYLHVLALNPAAAPDLATTYLTDPSLIETNWCRDEYSSLALAWLLPRTRRRCSASSTRCRIKAWTGGRRDLRNTPRSRRMPKPNGSFGRPGFGMPSGSGEPHCRPNAKRRSTGPYKNSATPMLGRSNSSLRKRARFAEPTSRRGRLQRSCRSSSLGDRRPKDHVTPSPRWHRSYASPLPTNPRPSLSMRHSLSVSSRFTFARCWKVSKWRRTTAGSSNGAGS
jgi:hypothetical protein